MGEFFQLHISEWVAWRAIQQSFDGYLGSLRLRQKWRWNPAESRLCGVLFFCDLQTDHQMASGFRRIAEVFHGAVAVHSPNPIFHAYEPRALALHELMTQ